MADALYDFGREGFLAADIDWDAHTINMAMVDTGVYTFAASHQFWTEVAGDVSGLVFTPKTLSGKTVANGIANAADDTFTGASGATVEALVLYSVAADEGTSRLIAYIDGATGLPVTLNGGDVTVTWDNTASVLIFKL